MILVDTSVWIEHLKGKNRACSLDELLKKDRVIFHSWVFGELMLGNLGPKKEEIQLYLSLLRMAPDYPVSEVIKFVEEESLSGKGLSLIDAQLLYGTVKERYFLWTLDKALRKAAQKFDRAFK